MVVRDKVAVAPLALAVCIEVDVLVRPLAHRSLAHQLLLLPHMSAAATVRAPRRPTLPPPSTLHPPTSTHPQPTLRPSQAPGSTCFERCEYGSAKSEGVAGRWRLLPALEVLRVPPPRPPSRPRLPIEAAVGVGTCATGKAGPPTRVLEPPTAIPAQATLVCRQRANTVVGQAGAARAPQMQRMRAVPTTSGNDRRTFGFRLSRALTVEARS